MKNNGILPYFWAFFFAAMAALSAVSCLLSAFGLEGGGDTLILVTALFALYFAAVGAVKRGWLSFALSALPFLLLLLPSVFNSFIKSMYCLLFGVTTQLSEFYSLLDGAAQYCGERAGSDCFTFAMFLSALISALMAHCVAKSRPVWPAMLLPVLLLVPCLFIIETLPATAPLLCFVGTMCLLVITQRQRWQNPKSGGKLTAILLLPVFLLAILIAAIWPKESYERSPWPDKTREELTYALGATAAKLQGEAVENPLLPDLEIGGLVGAELYSVDLSGLGPRRYLGLQVMQVKAEDSGNIYLRGVAFGSYDNNTWSSADSESYNGINPGPFTATPSGDHIKELSIRTSGVFQTLFTPYFLSALPDGVKEVKASYASNSQGLTEYTLRYCEETRVSVVDESAYNYYLYVPNQLWDCFNEITYDEQFNDVPYDQRPQAVANYIKSCAVYDLNTPAVPDGEDFVLWFLQESHQGYCVHFATAACMLLRWMGIPARYVTGYLATAKDGQWAKVADSDAHAWVEYYMEGVGWIPLEVTPGGGQAVTVASQPPQGSAAPTPTPEVSASVPSAAPTPAVSAPPVVSQSQTPVEKAPVQSEKKSAAGLLWLLVIAVILAAPFAWRWAALTEKKRRYKSGGGNAKALLLWRDIQRMSKALKEEPPESLYSLAEKARFSQHTLEKRELSELIAYRDSLQKHLEAETLIKQALYKYVLVLY